MNNRAIADLCADSLGAVLSAARRRRIRRRAIAACGGAVALTVIGILLGPSRSPEHKSMGVSPMNIGPTPQFDPQPPHIVRTTTGSLIRISTTAKASVIRLKTSPTANVRRIDTPALADFFPGNGIAVIHGDSEPPRAVFF